MRLKTFTAPTTAEAMRMVRAEMGDDAIIVSSQRDADGGGARVTAALEDFADEHEDFGAVGGADLRKTESAIREALNFHGTPPRLIERLIEEAGCLKADNPTLALAGALDAHFGFRPLNESGDAKPIMLVGPPGAGKTITAAKLAARATLAGRKPYIATIDTKRAGGVEQLSVFTRILELDLKTVKTVDEMRRLAETWKEGGPIYIDTMGVNPYSDTEMETLDQFIKAAGAEAVLVMAAGCDAMEAADTATSFSLIGARRLLVTRLDIARRLGGTLAAADVLASGHMKFCNVSITPQIADGLSPINPASLARLIMPGSTETMQELEISPMTEATL
jgi:flagellar biosynthesis protein FlhF